MQVKELNSFVANDSSIISAGQSASSKETRTKIMTAQYPAERSAAVDNVSETDIGQAYQNGLLFTAYEYNPRTSNSMASFRTATQKITKAARSGSIKSVLKSVTTEDNKLKALNDPVANILMPRSKSDSDQTNHKFNDVGESIVTKGGGTATGILSNMMSTAVFGAVESMTKGAAFADFGEQIYNTSRSMYGGAENRTKTYTWDLTPRSYEDLTQIIKIYEIFNYLSYGDVGNSKSAKDIKKTIDDIYRKTIMNPINEATKSQTRETTMEALTSFLSNVIVVSNPTVWTIQNFGTSSPFDGIVDVFGPAQIQSIRFDKSPDGQFNGLAAAPNMPSSFVLEVTFREILTLNRTTVYGESPL